VIFHPRGVRLRRAAGDAVNVIRTLVHLLNCLVEQRSVAFLGLQIHMNMTIPVRHAFVARE
jgi:hypothetical protein